MKVDFEPQSKEHEKVLSNICPDCGEELLEGPTGGLTIMKRCTHCESRFVDCWLFGSSRVVDKT